MKLNSLYLKKFLIIRTSSLGDIIHSLPFLSSLKKSFPTLEFFWLVNPSFSQILKNNPYLSGIVLWEKKNLWKLANELKKVSFDASFDLQGLFRSAIFPFFARIPHRWGRKETKEKVGIFYTETFHSSSSHIVDQYLDWVEFLGAERIVEFPLPKEEKWEERAKHYFSSTRKKIIIIPGGGWENKRWPWEKYAKLAHILSKKEFDIFIFWGIGERDLADRIKRESLHKAEILPFLDIPGMVSFFKRADVIVGGDTGPLHLASALGVPVVGIYGPTDPERNGPYGKNKRIVSKSLPCSPCWKRKCKEKNVACLEKIEVEEVVERVEELEERM